MYKKFFEFKERPFKLVPNPDYLFLSKSHEEALGYLNYTILQGEGFVEITGEVGTGKTTLCRVFLESLDENTEAAYIFNPKMDSVQLLQAINDEYGIVPNGTSTRELTDSLNAFLIEKKKQGKNVILLVDEAQNLTSDVLEQLRLLSNLETTSSKLIQIILVGQPELDDTLDSYELRQLSQRITLRCHIKPLSLKETSDYIEHRIRIASHKPGINFSRSAYKAIYRYAGGIPRLINIVCDRSLLKAFTIDSKKITAGIVNSAVNELQNVRQKNRIYGIERKKPVLLFLSLLLIFFIIMALQPVNLSDVTLNHNSSKQNNVKGNKSHDSIKQNTANTVPGRAGSIRKQPVIVKNIKPFNLLITMDNLASRSESLMAAFELWETDAKMNDYLKSIDNDKAFFSIAAKQNGLMCNRVECDLAFLKKINLPAILELYLPGALSPRYVTVCEIDDNMVGITKEGFNMIMSGEALSAYWTGGAYIIWKNFFNYAGVVPVNASRETILTLKVHLRSLGFDAVTLSPVYDDVSRKAVEKIQNKYGLKIDGFFGPMTMIALYNEDDSLKIPHIVKRVSNISR